VDPLDFPADEADDEADDRAYAVRPYALTGGRTRATKPDLALEALVQALDNAAFDSAPARLQADALSFDAPVTRWTDIPI